MGKYHDYVYTGPVFLFDDCINRYWKAETIAVSKEKAKLAVGSKISLPGKIKTID